MPSAPWRRLLSRITALLIALALLAAFMPSPAAAATLPPISIRINGEIVPTDVPPYIANDRTMVPIRAISEGLGARVAWYEDSRRVYVRLDAAEMWLTVGSTTALVNKMKVTLDAAPSITSGRTMVPLRFVSENIGAKVTWDNTTRTVIIEKRDYKVTKIEWLRQNGQGQLYVFSQGIIGEPKVSTVSSPDRLIIDIPDVVIPLDWPDQVINDGNIYRIRAGMLSTNPNVARVVLDLVQPMDFKAYRTDTRNQVVVDMGYKANGVTVGAGTTGTEQAIKLTTTGPVVFKTMTLTGPDRVVVDVDKATLSKNITQIVPQPAGNPLVSQVRIAQFSADPDVVRMVVDLKAPAAYGVASAADGLTVYVAPQQAAAPIKYAKSGLNGRLTVSGTGALTITERNELPGKLVFDVAGLPPASATPVSRPVFDGVVNRITYSPVAGVPNATRVTVELPYYLGHKGTLSTDKKTYTVDVTGSTLLGKVVVLDPGHGGDDPGTGSVSGLIDEKTVDLDISFRLRDLLTKAGAQVQMTRTTATENPTLQRRVEFANSRDADIFLSIHNNSYLAREAGTETYWYNSNPGSPVLAGIIQNSVVGALGRPNRGVKTSSFTVIKDTTMPAALVECLFMSNTTDEAMLRDPAVRQKIAKALYDALFAFAGR